MCCARELLTVRGVDGNGSLNAARRADRSKGIDDTMVQ